MNFSKEQKDYIIHALEHCEVLTGGRSSGKTLELIKQQDKEIERLTKQNKALNEMYELTKKEYIRLNNIINELEKYFEQEGFWHSLDKIKELKGER